MGGVVKDPLFRQRVKTEINEEKTKLEQEKCLFKAAIFLNLVNPEESSRQSSKSLAVKSRETQGKANKERRENPCTVNKCTLQGGKRIACDSLF